MREIIWTKHGENAFNEILEYITQNSGPINSSKIYEKVIGEIELLKSERVKTRKSQELLSIGIDDIYELDIHPWKVYYKIINDNKTISIQQIIDSRRNIEELLVTLIIEKKI
ncbi:type II toxin-antitoxin system RelE/ParE family toxin [Treponema sp. TIM-1]|uniref:type II toxin-antitoxin system RelE/ParE family toxin n=1 Tax=Treponema sp. TIM-1 TaxID=2898417 RepID=UPI0039806F91